MKIEKTVPWWFFDYVWKPIVVFLIIFGVKVIAKYSDGKVKIFNEKTRRTDSFI